MNNRNHRSIQIDIPIPELSPEDREYILSSFRSGKTHASYESLRGYYDHVVSIDKGGVIHVNSN